LTRIAVFSDLHGNLPALSAILIKIKELECDYVVNLGDSIAIGAFSNECIDILKSTKIISIIGNHEEYLIKGINRPIPNYMSEGEYNHRIFVHKQISKENRKYISKWKEIYEIEIEGRKCLFTHSPFEKRIPYNEYVNVNELNIKEICNAFSKYHAELIFFGHSHTLLEIYNNRLYVNPGSVGCHKEPVALFSVIDIKDKEIDTHNYQVEYSKEILFDALDKRQIPEREFIKKIFF